MHSLLISAFLSAAALSPLAHGRAIDTAEKRGIIWEPAPSQGSGNHIFTVESPPTATLATLLEREDTKTSSKASRSRAKPTRSTAAPAATGAADPAPAPFVPGTASLSAGGSQITWSAEKRDVSVPSTAYPTAAAGSISNQIDSAHAVGSLNGGSASLQLSESSVTFYPSDGGSTTVSAGQPESEPEAQVVQPIQAVEPVQPAQPPKPKPTSKSPPKFPGYPKPKPKPTTNYNEPPNDAGTFGVEIDSPSSALAPITNADGTNGGQQGLELTSSSVTFYPSTGGSSTVTTGKGKGGSSSGIIARDPPKTPKPVQTLGIGSSSTTFYPANGAPKSPNTGKNGRRPPTKRDTIVNSPQPGTTESLSIASSSFTFSHANGGSSTTIKQNSKRDSVAMPFQA